MGNVLDLLAVSPFQPSAQTCLSVNLGTMNRRSLRTWTPPAQGSRKSYLQVIVISLHSVSLNGFAVWDMGKDFHEEHSGRQLMLPEVLDKVMYHISVSCYHH